MKRRIVSLLALATVFTGGVFFLNATPGANKNIRHISEVLNTAEPFSIIATIPDVSGFTAKLREGDAMRAFFDSPLGLHFLRSAPTRGAAHLHRFISLAPKSWQWNLYTLITDGPVFYRSSGKKFCLVVALNNRGKLITSLVTNANAVKEGDWLVIASDKETLEAQQAYLKKPSSREFALDSYLGDGSTLALAVGNAGDGAKKKSLTRALLQQAFGAETFAGCNFKIRPGGDILSLEGECPRSGEIVAVADEKISLGNFPGYVYFRKPGAKTAHVIALGGFAVDYGYLIPHLFYSGPSGDQKSIEFLSQAFKTKGHKLETKGDALQISYPSPYTYRNTKFDLFAPHLVANRERFFWHSYLPFSEKPPTTLNLSATYNLFASVKIYPLLKNSEAALKQFDAIYSPGHFNEFRDALAKSMPALKKASVKIFTQPAGNKLRIGGAFNFADT
jgi:hypothetical protein